MKKQNIRVYDYKKHKHMDKNSPVPYYDVEAFCIDGKYGVFAVFMINENIFCEAHGDDGHWWVVGEFDKYWLEGIIDCLTSLEHEVKEMNK